MNDPLSIQERIQAADKLLSKSTTTGQQLESLRKLLQGVNPKLDRLLTTSSSAFTKVEKLWEGDVIDLAADTLPENSEKERKRKKTLLLLLSTWRQLKGEVSRIEGELAHATAHGASAAQKTTSVGRIVGLAKGPLGIVTILAAVIVLIKTTSVTIEIINDGCNSIESASSVRINLPGLSLPSESIPSGGRATAQVPRVNLTVDGTQEGIIRLSGYGLNMNFNFSAEGTDVIFDGKSLVGQRTEINLGSRPLHEAIIRCTR